MKKFIILIVSLLSAANCVYCQEEIKGFLATPNVASLGIFGQIPVSLFTGTPQINIPLYNLEANGISVPIELSYHTNLVKPRNHESWVGLGWGLMAGGSITRIPNGLRDELDKVYSYNNNYSKLSTPTDWENGDISSATNSSYLLQCVNNACYDLQPDEFVFTFGKYSGSFFKNHLGEWQIRSENGNNFKIQSRTANSNYSVWIKNLSQYNQYLNDYYPFEYKYYTPYLAFTITAEDGTIYEFGSLKDEDWEDLEINESLNFIDYNGWFRTSNNYIEGNHTVTDSYGPVSSMPYGYIDTWHLKRIITPNISTVQDSESNFPTTYLWGYGEQYPIAKIAGVTYNELMNNISGSSQSFFQFIFSRNLTPDDPMYLSFRNILIAAAPDAEVSTYTYKPLVGLTSIIDPREVTTYFNYDNFGKLQNIKDNSNKILSDFTYHYATAEPPVINTNNIIINGNKITITYIGCSHFINAATISYQVVGSAVVTSNTSGCYGTATITVPYQNTNYKVTVTLHNSLGLQLETSINVFVP